MKITDIEVGTILDGLILLEERYENIDKEFLSGAREEYIDAIKKLHNIFSDIAYNKGSVYISNE